MNKKSYLFITLSTFAVCCSGFSQNQPSSSSSPIVKGPLIVFSGETEVVGNRSDQSVTLPKYTLYGSKGEILGDENLEIKHYVDGEIDQDKEYIAGPSAGYYCGGSHSFDFTLTDPNTKEINEKQVTLELYQRILGEGGDTMSDYVKGYGLQDEKIDPYYRTTNEGWAVRNFYLDRGYQYYAEAYFPGYDGEYRSFGMLHSDKLDINSSNFYRDEIFGNPLTGSFGYVSGYKWSNSIENDSTWFTQGPTPILTKAIDLKVETVKCACARDGDDFYFFLNDKLVTKHTIDVFKNRETLPGFVLGSYNAGENKNRTNTKDATGFSFYGGRRAVNKINSLIKDYKTFDYLRYDGDPKYEWATFNNDDSAKGMGFKYTELALDHAEQFWNYSVSPKVKLWGDFKIDFDYEVLGMGTDWGNMRIAFADSRYGDNGSKTELFNLHSGLYLFYNTSLSMQNYTFMSKGGWEQNVESGFNYQTLKNNLKLKDSIKDKIHICVVKKENFLNNTEEFTYTFSKDAYTYEVKSVVSNVVINGVDLLDQIRPLYIYFTVDRMFYSISNFTYECLNVFE